MRQSSLWCSLLASRPKLGLWKEMRFKIGERSSLSMPRLTRGTLNSFRFKIVAGENGQCSRILGDSSFFSLSALLGEFG